MNLLFILNKGTEMDTIEEWIKLSIKEQQMLVAKFNLQSLGSVQTSKELEEYLKNRKEKNHG